MTSMLSQSTSSEFLSLVLAHMSSAGIIPAELARRLGCTDQNVALLLTPGRDYKLSTMERIAAAVGFRFRLSLANLSEKEARSPIKKSSRIFRMEETGKRKR